MGSIRETPESEAPEGVRKQAGQDAPEFFYGECPVCEFSVVTRGVPPKLASNCGLCAEDSGRDVWMRFRPATDDDKAEGYDARRAYGEKQ